MWTDYSSLTWVQWKHFRSEAIYWLRVLGWDPTSSAFYRIYFLAFWVFWLFTMWRYVVEQISRISPAIPPETITRLMTDTPSLLLAVTLLYLAVMLRRSPIMLSAPEMTMVVASPIKRGALALSHFLRGMLIPAGGIAGVFCLLTMTLTWATAKENAGFAGLWALLIGIPLVLANGALIWSVALLRMRPNMRQRGWIFWVVLAIIAAAAYLVPDVGLWTGHLWQRAIAQVEFPTLEIGIALVVMIVSFVLLWLSGEGMHLTLVAEASRTYARIQSLGLLSRLYMQESVEQIKRQAALSRKRRLVLTLPDRAAGNAVLRNRALLSLFRLAPGTLLRPLIRGLTMTALLMTAISVSDARALQTWLLVLLILLFSRPRELITVFRQDIGQVFMSQMIVQDHLVRFFTDSLVPLFMMMVGNTAVLLLHPTSDKVGGFVLILLVTVGLGFAQALEVVEDAVIVFRPIPYEYTVLIGGGLSIAAGLVFKSLTAGIIVLALVEAVFAMLLANSRT